MQQAKHNVNGYWLGAGHRNRLNPTWLNCLVWLFGVVHCALPARLSALTLRCRPLSQALTNHAGGR
jgi:hypothetical protein